MALAATLVWLPLHGVSADPVAATPDPEIACRVYFGDACSEAMGRWLPRVPNGQFEQPAAPTAVEDQIIDPAGLGKPAPFGETEVYGGTRFVYGSAGPPKGDAVYDPVHHLAYYDEGCCSWHHVVLASNVPPPPKAIATRSLTGLSTARGLRLGVDVATVERTYGPNKLREVAGQPDQRTLSYVHPFGGKTCEDLTTFLFERGKLVAMDLLKGC